MSLFGFGFHETMRGTYHFLDRPLEERAIELSIAVEGNGLRQFFRSRTAGIRLVPGLGRADER